MRGTWCDIRDDSAHLEASGRKGGVDGSLDSGGASGPGASQVQRAELLSAVRHRFPELKQLLRRRFSTDLTVPHTLCDQMIHIEAHAQRALASAYLTCSPFYRQMQAGPTNP